MNAERLHAIVLSLEHELNERRTVPNLESMTSTLRAVVQATNASTQQAFATALENIYSALTNTNSDSFSPTWRQILREIGGEELFGAGLKGKIERTLEKNQITPAMALQEFDKDLSRLKEFAASLSYINSAFVFFKIGSEKLTPGESEIGILIPRDYVKNQLAEFVVELKREEFILNTFSEVATGKVDKLEIKTISSSGLMVFLHSNSTFAAMLAIAIERIVKLYKNLLEIRKIGNDLRKQQLPEAVVKDVETHANKVMKEGIEAASVEIVDQFYTKADDGRKNELVTKVRVAMNMLANRIDHGVNVEVRVEPPAPNDPKAKDEKVQRDIAAIQSAAPSMQFLKLEGQPLLQLPETIEKEERSEKSEKAKKKESGHAT